jgi:hypothetical protein
VTQKRKVSRKGAPKRGLRRRQGAAGRQHTKRRSSRRPVAQSPEATQPRLKVSADAGKVSPDAQKTPTYYPRPKRGGGGVHLENTLKEQEVLDALLEPNVRTYADAAKRLGITENAVKQRMSRVLFRYRKAKSYANRFDQWRVKRRESRETRASRNHRVIIPPVIRTEEAPIPA